MREDLTELREHYELWVKFLQANDKYEEYCKYFERCKKEVTKRLGKKASEDAIFDAALEGVADKYKLKFLRTYVIFGDVFKHFDFGEWWGHRFTEIWNLQKEEMLRGITLFDASIPDVVSKLVKDVCVECKHEDEVIETAIHKRLSRLLGERHGFMLLKVDTNFPKDRLFKEFVAAIEKHKEDHNITRWSELRHINEIMFQPIVGRLSEDRKEYKMYLEAYKLARDERGFEDIAIALRRQDSNFVENGKITDYGKKMIRRYITRGRRIMKNLEKCEFPGDYQQEPTESLPRPR
jgi:hypothetical protein